MVANITRGKTFATNAEVTNEGLHDLVDDATVSLVDQSNMDSSVGIVATASAAPSDTDAAWANSALSTRSLLINDGSGTYDGTPVVLRLTNASGGTRAAGYPVRLSESADNTFVDIDNIFEPGLTGILLESTANSAAGYVCFCGRATTTANGTITQNDPVRPANNGGTFDQVVTCSRGNPGCMGIALTTATDGNSVDIFVSPQQRTSDLVLLDPGQSVTITGAGDVDGAFAWLGTALDISGSLTSGHVASAALISWRLTHTLTTAGGNYEFAWRAQGSSSGADTSPHVMFSTSGLSTGGTHYHAQTLWVPVNPSNSQIDYGYGQVAGTGVLASEAHSIWLHAYYVRSMI